MNDTLFAPAQRATREELQRQIEFVIRNPLLDSLMKVANGLMAVLNETRQVVAMNESLMALLGIEDTKAAFGLRPGEAIQCIHADEGPSGCGTTAFCSSCGAAVAMVASLAENRPIEKTCAINTRGASGPSDWYLRVRACPLSLNGDRFILLFLQDITRQQQWINLERVFFHDISNIITSLVGTCELLALGVVEDKKTMAEQVCQIALRLAREVEIQKNLLQSDACEYAPRVEKATFRQMSDELRGIYAGHEAAQGKQLVFAEGPVDEAPFRVDRLLLTRVLENMILNALEATGKGGDVRVWRDPAPGAIAICVWNRKPIPPDVARRIFQRNFSTKGEAGRGLGTYSTKLFGEKYLGGKVSFDTSEANGTTFRIQLPA